MVKMTRGASPRRVGGGRSDRHESRHKAQGYTRTNAPEWSDAGARAAMEVLQGLSAECGTSIVQEARKVLRGERTAAGRRAKTKSNTIARIALLTA